MESAKVADSKKLGHFASRKEVDKNTSDTLAFVGVDSLHLLNLPSSLITPKTLAGTPVGHRHTGTPYSVPA